MLGVAQQVAKDYNHQYIGTEHFLVALVREEAGIAAQALLRLGLTPTAVEKAVLAICQDGPPAHTLSVNLEKSTISNALPRTYAVQAQSNTSPAQLRHS